MGNKSPQNSTADKNAENSEKISSSANPTTGGAIGLVVLIITIVTLTSLLNNQNISTLETRTRQLEARLQTLQDETAALVKKFIGKGDAAPQSLETNQVAQAQEQNDELTAKSETVTEETTTAPVQQNELLKMLESQAYETSLETEVMALVQEQSDQFKGLEAQLQTLKGETMTASYQQNELFKAQKRETAQSVETLRAQMIALAQEQNDKLNGLVTQLQTLRGETTEVLMQQNEQLKALANQATELEATLKADRLAQDDKHNGLTIQLQTLADETTIHVNQISEQATQLETALKGEITALAEEQDGKINGLTAQLQTLATETAAIDKQQDEQMEQQSRQAVHQVSQLQTSLKADMGALAQEQNDKLKGVEAQLQTFKGETMTALYQHNQLLKAQEQQATQLEASLEANGVALNGLRAQLQTMSEETTTSVNSISQQAQEQSDKVEATQLETETSKKADMEIAPSQEQ